MKYQHKTFLIVWFLLALASIAAQQWWLFAVILVVGFLVFELFPPKEPPPT